VSAEPEKQTIWRLLKQALDDLPETFTSAEAVAWFEDHGHTYRPISIQTHLHDLAVNRGGRPRTQRIRGGEPFIYRVGPGRFTRYRPEVHGHFTEDGQLADGDNDDGSDTGQPSDDQSEFALELHLEEFMEANWSSINFGRRIAIWSDEEVSGRQFQTDVGIIDFLCVDEESGDYVVLELKKGKTNDAVVGQIQRYKGWIRRNVAEPGQGVRGMIVAHEADDKLKYALSETPNIDLMTYKVSFALSPEGLDLAEEHGDD
jgi:hypothetical protein